MKDRGVVVWWLYLDESGDLGFDFINRKPSRYFTICILATSHRDTNTQFAYAVRKTLKRKVNHHRKNNPINELHASSLPFPVKQYVYSLLLDHIFGIYAITLNKKRVYQYLIEDKEKVYNYVARQVIDRIPFEMADKQVILTVDKSKGTKARHEFNGYITAQLKGRLAPDVKLAITHEASEASAGLQLADLFAWGVFRKYERNDPACFELFKEKILYDGRYL